MSLHRQLAHRFGLLIVLLVAPARGMLAQSPTAPGEHKVLLNGVNLWYKIAGAPQPGAAPLIYLPGGPGYNSYSFEKTIGPQLERHAQMIYFDERGTGRSERPASHDYAMSTLTADIEALRKSLGVARLSVMGQSFGGTIALEYARRYPEHVQKLILVDAAVDLPDTFLFWQRQIESQYPADWKKALASDDGLTLRSAEEAGVACAATQARFRTEMKVLGSPGHADFHRKQQFHTLRYAGEQDALDARSGLRNTGELSNFYLSAGQPFLCYQFTDYGRLTMPVLVIRGRYDGAISREQAERLATHVPNAQYDEFENSAHFPYAEEPAKFERDVASFLTVR